MGVTVITRAPTNLLTTIDHVKAELGSTVTTNDDMLWAMIARASNAITKECLGGADKSFGVQTVQETLKGTGSQILGLTLMPVLAVSQVLQDTEVVNPLDPDQGYSIEDGDAGALFRPCGWGQTVNLLSWGWEAYGSRYILPGGTQTLRYTVTYTAGYILPIQQQYALSSPVVGTDFLYDPSAGLVLDTAVPPTTLAIPPILNTPWTMADAPPLPGDVEQACLVTVKTWWFSRQRDWTILEQRMGDQMIRYVEDAGQYLQLPAPAMGLIRDYRRVI